MTIIDCEDFFEYTPGILRTLVEPEHYKKLHVKHTEYLSDARVVVGHVKSVNKSKVVLMDGREVKYDYLIIASGSHYNSPIKEQDTFFAARVKHLLEAHKRIQNAEKIAVVGGGLVGVELSAELATHYKNKKIMLIHSGPRLIERNNVKSSMRAKDFLEKHGVEVLLNDRIIENVGKKLIGESGKKYDYDSVFYTVGIKPNVDFMRGDFSKFVSKGINVNEYLQISGLKNVFVAGDASAVKEEKTAQNAEYHGNVAAHNVLALIHGKEMKRYVPKKRLMVISLGKYSGIIEYNGFVIGGIIPAFLKWAIEKAVMLGFR